VRTNKNSQESVKSHYSLSKIVSSFIKSDPTKIDQKKKLFFASPLKYFNMPESREEQKQYIETYSAISNNTHIISFHFQNKGKIFLK